jgi:hypothetical protein
VHFAHDFPKQMVGLAARPTVVVYIVLLCDEFVTPFHEWLMSMLHFPDRITLAPLVMAE